MSELAERCADWMLRNASIRHGHPPEVSKRVEGAPPVADPSQPDANLMPAAPGDSSLLSKLPKAAAVAIALSTGALGLSAATYLFGPAEPSKTPTTIVQPGDASLYQYLEDNGYHLANGGPNP